MVNKQRYFSLVGTINEVSLGNQDVDSERFVFFPWGKRCKKQNPAMFDFQKYHSLDVSVCFFFQKKRCGRVKVGSIIFPSQIEALCLTSVGIEMDGPIPKISHHMGTVKLPNV